MHRIAGWWDGFELWVAGLPFIPQFLVVLVGMVPISTALAYGLDRVVRAVLRRADRGSVTAAASIGPVQVGAPLAAEPERLVVDDRAPVSSGAR
ncbi:hypothetical protein [Nocardia sp. CNY236]|uniref:hypothetical protein n=1 Tax=Nocardia sp. CNY236 TaxID=1169152 RepID=UPI000402A926|nr:hypothetical protein [Nocardia sp. CNY236]